MNIGMELITALRDWRLAKEQEQECLQQLQRARAFHQHASNRTQNIEFRIYEQLGDASCSELVRDGDTIYHIAKDKSMKRLSITLPVVHSLASDTPAEASGGEP